MSRINLTDNTLSMVSKMSDGNPGALTSMLEMLNPEHENIDPDSVMKGLGKVLDLDTLGIYGTDIYVFVSDICNKDMVKVFGVLRAYQLGFLSGDVLADACSRQDYSGREMIDIEGLLTKVRERLPNFKQD